MRWILGALATMAALLLAGLTFAEPSWQAPVVEGQLEAWPSSKEIARSGGVVAFVMDSKLDPAFVEGHALSVKQDEKVNHGSLVARVIRRYCSVPVVGLPVESPAGNVDREAYHRALQKIIEYTRRHPEIHVLVNISLGSPEPEAEEENLIRKLRKSGALIIAAAGNEDSEERFYPAAYEGVISVASATPKEKSLHSNYGNWIDISASGDITFIDSVYLPYRRLRREMEARGTSFAAPRITAGLALILRKNPENSHDEAVRILEGVCRRIKGNLFNQGQLGAGVLQIKSVKLFLRPSYKWFHTIVPAVIGILLFGVSVFLCVQKGITGLFLTLLIWIVGLPGVVGIVLFVSWYWGLLAAGISAHGPATAILCGTVGLICAGVLHFRAKDVLMALLPPAFFGLALRTIGTVPLMSAAGMGLVAGLLTLALLRRRAKILDQIRSTIDKYKPEQAAVMLANLWGKTHDPEIQKEITETARSLPPDEALDALEWAETDPRWCEAIAGVLRERLEEEQT
ncbi:MAG: S8 family serine peptidase [Planctomycetes bacterium]|nr:S8 family serine peptidase [Planctomycetota bacterium]